ncbi:hypothetical protein GGX14DRAFT_554098 [Mycena pura]|uniref:Uncharacterized protein n=1 Tax=Mycena pura TaxID=153505 RepID=A0AAD7E631_9AGAR|nr:hypothetical protein GGX14DRAFT_554098 [Mycena pura]
MCPAAAELGCAQNADGTLKDASEIEWQDNPDNDQPTSTPASSSKPALAPIFDRAKPLGKIAGSRRPPSPRRSARATRPSARITDPDNAVGTTATAVKRKSAGVAPSARKVLRLETVSGTSTDSDNETEPASEAEGADSTEASVIDLREYEKYKAHADVDHAAKHAKISREDHTADLNTVYKRVKVHAHPVTGVPEDGAICLVCIKKHLPYSDHFLKGGVSSLRKHIARQVFHKDHYEVYEAGCVELGIPMNEAAIPPKRQGPGCVPPSA